MHKKLRFAASMFFLAGLSVVLLGGASAAVAGGNQSTSCPPVPQLNGCVESALDKQVAQCLTAALSGCANPNPDVDGCLVLLKAKLEANCQR